MRRVKKTRNLLATMAKVSNTQRKIEDNEEPVERLLWGTDWVGEESAVMRGRERGRMGEAVDGKA